MTQAIGTVERMNGVPVLVCPGEGESLRSEGHAVDVIGEALGLGAAWVAVPAGRMAPDVFDLSTGLAGAFAQKFAQYGVGLALVGDITAYTTTSGALRALVHEANRGTALWFVHDLDELRSRMNGTGTADG